MSKYRGIAFGVTQGQRSPKKLQPPADFGRKAIELAESVGRTEQDILRATKYDSKKTLDRLIKGEGSMHFAVAVLQALQSWGADVSKLPSLEVGGVVPGIENASEWVQEWARLGRKLWATASDEKLAVEMDRLRKLVEAAELMAEGTDKIKPLKRP